MQVVFQWLLRIAGMKLTQVVAKASIDVLVKNTKTPYDDYVWEKVKEAMNWK